MASTHTLPLKCYLKSWDRCNSFEWHEVREDHPRSHPCLDGGVVSQLLYECFLSHIRGCPGLRLAYSDGSVAEDDCAAPITIEVLLQMVLSKTERSDRRIGQVALGHFEVWRLQRDIRKKSMAEPALSVCCEAMDLSFFKPEITRRFMTTQATFQVLGMQEKC